MSDPTEFGHSAQAVALAAAVREYLDERDNPAPDMTMRSVSLTRVRVALDDFEALLCPHCGSRWHAESEHRLAVEEAIRRA